MGITLQRAISSINPDTLGAEGDGVTDDTSYLQSAFSSGLNVELTPGKTYLHRQVLTINNNGVTIYGNGATLKRAAQGITTTTTSIVSGVTTAITVASTAGFAVGDQIVVEQSGTYDANAHTITSIVGLVITVGAAFTVSLSGTINVRTGWNQITINADDCRVTGVVLDGNSSNWSWGRWQHTCGIAQYSSSSPSYSVHGRCLIDHNRIINQYGDGASPSGYNCIFAYNDVENIQGRGISWAGNSTLSDVGSKCIYNRFYNCDIDSNVSANDGHGNIQISSQTGDLLIHGNQIDTGIAGIGSINSSDDSDVTITNNVIRNMTTYAIEGDCSSNTNHADNVIIANNRIYSSGEVWLQNGGIAGNGSPSRWQIKNNLFYETVLLISAAYDLSVSGNTFYSAGSLLTFINTGFGTGNAIYVNIVDNKFEGGAYGCDLGGNALHYVMFGNKFVGQAQAAIRISGSTSIIVSKNNIVGNGSIHGIHLNTGSGSGSNVLIEGNKITGQITDSIDCTWSTTSVTIKNNMIISDSNASSYYGININEAIEASGNYVDFSVGTSTHGIGVFGTTTGARVIGNTTKGGSNTNDCVIGASNTNAVVQNNSFSHAISDSGTGTTKSGNVINGGPLSGRATLVAGTVTVSNAEVRTADNIQLANVVTGGTVGTLSIGTIVQGTSFVINSSSNTDTSTVFWKIDH